MSREIKYRFWNKKIGAMIDWDLMKKECDRLSIFTHPDFIPLEFCGLVDKNGKEIFEGDIVQYKSYHAFRRWWSNLEDIPVIDAEVQKQREDISIVKAKVRFDDGAFELDYPVTLQDVKRGQRFTTGGRHNGETESKQWDFEVIGNIYENPELLEKEESNE